MVDLNYISRIAFINAKKREKADKKSNSVDTIKMLQHTACEVIEATEAFAVKNMFGSEMFASELADIICCVLIIAGENKIDMEKALVDCLEKNRKRAEGIGDKK